MQSVLPDMFPESQHLEYKRELSESLEREVVGFLNHREGGKILIGIDDNAQVVGLADPDGDQLKIKDRLKQNILPSCMGLFDVLLEQHAGKAVICIIVASGSEKPYYLRRQGMSPRGCFLRVGSATEPMPERMIEQLFASRTRNSIGRIAAPRQDLTFTQLKIYYEGIGHVLNAQFAKYLELLTENGSYNYAAYLLADQNTTSIKVAKYAGIDRVDLIESEEYGNCCLIKAAKQVLDKLELENRTLTRITSKERMEQRLYDAVAVREAVINAIVHNEYSHEVPPKFELFADRLEITSAGGIPQGLTQQEFFQGYSVPRNKEMMRIFRDLEMVEYLGSGIPRILSVYPKESFVLTDNFLRMVFPSKEVSVGENVGNKLGNKLGNRLGSVSGKMSGKTSGKILERIKKDPFITIPVLAQAIGVTERSIERNLQTLREAELIRRVEGAKGGHWEILKQDES